MSEVDDDSCQICNYPSLDEEKRHLNRKYRNAIFSAFMLILGLCLQLFSASLILIYSAFLASIFVAGRYIIPKGIKGLAKLRLDQHLLMTLGSLAAVLIGAPAEGAAVMFLFYISTLLEERAEDRNRKEIQKIMELEPPSVIVRAGNGEICISPEAIRKGDTILVRPGDRIGLDGIISHGETFVNQASITGESLPVEKSIGSQVYAGTINLDGYIEVEVTEESKNTLLSRIIQLVNESRKNKAPVEKTISQFSTVYTPSVVSLSVLVAVISMISGQSIADAIYRSLTLLVISCPCAFAVSIPMSMVSAIAGSARNGVLVKGAIHIEQMSKTSIVAFDKTGTLTEGLLSVEDVCLHNNHTRQEVLSAAASIETMSEHPIGKALLEVASRENLEKLRPSEFMVKPGRGVIGRIEKTEYLVGNRKLMLENNVALEPIDRHICGAGTMVYVGRESEHLGTIVLSDSIRPGTREAIGILKKMGIRTMMLTGDSNDIAKDIADGIGIDEYRAELLPNQKVEVIRELKESGITLMIGDGINDTPALAAAHVGVAMGVAGSDAALEAADVALMKDDLTKIPKMISNSKKTMQVVRQNVVTSLSVKAVIGMLASIGLISLWIAIGFGDMGLTFLVIANALRLAKQS